jgi:hypothetical protein
LPFDKNFGEPNLESPTTTALDDSAASKAQIDSLRQENSALKLKEQCARTEHKQLLLNLATEKEEAQAHQETLRRTISELQAAVTKSDIKEQKYQELERTVASLTQKNSDLVRDLKTADHRTTNLQKIILKNNSDSSNQIDDTAITWTFRGLVKQIQRLVSAYNTMPEPPPEPYRSPGYWDMELYRLWNYGVDEQELQRRVRGFVFQYMNDDILTRSYFGLDGLDANDQIEDGFESFEGLIRKTAEGISSGLYL